MHRPVLSVHDGDKWLSTYLDRDSVTLEGDRVFLDGGYQPVDFVTLPFGDYMRKVEELIAAAKATNTYEHGNMRLSAALNAFNQDAT